MKRLLRPLIYGTEIAFTTTSCTVNEGWILAGETVAQRRGDEPIDLAKVNLPR